MGWPILSSRSLRITNGPMPMPMTSAVMGAITARKGMYWNTRRKPSSGDRVCSHWARLSSMGTLLLQGLDHTLHLHEARALDQHAGHLRRERTHRGDERLGVVEMLRAGAEGRHAAGTEFAQR